MQNWKKYEKYYKYPHLSNQEVKDLARKIVKTISKLPDGTKTNLLYILDELYGFKQIFRDCLGASTTLQFGPNIYLHIHDDDYKDLYAIVKKETRKRKIFIQGITTRMGFQYSNPLTYVDMFIVRKPNIIELIE